MLLRDGDLIVFGTQNHGVPAMSDAESRIIEVIDLHHLTPPRPDITDGRVSLVIFFYPDADNLERQWQTINEDDEEEKTYADVS